MTVRGLRHKRQAILQQKVCGLQFHGRFLNDLAKGAQFSATSFGRPVLRTTRFSFPSGSVRKLSSLGACLVFLAATVRNFRWSISLFWPTV